MLMLSGKKRSGCYGMLVKVELSPVPHRKQFTQAYFLAVLVVSSAFAYTEKAEGTEKEG